MTPGPETTGFGLALLLSAFAFGFRHGIDWDHIAAITDISSSQPSVREGLRLSTLYAAGHAVVVFLIGIVAIVAGESLPDSIDEAMGRVVGVTLVALGIYVLYALIRYREEFRMRSRWMLVFSGVRRLYRSVRNRESVREPVAVGGGPHDLDHGHTHDHTDPFMNYGTGTSLAVGALHGVGAETPTQVVIFLAAAGAGGAGAGIATLTAFLVGLFVANTALALLSASGFLAASKRFRVYATVSVITAVASLVLGVSFIVGHDSWLPALFS
jgi:cytochrome c biogenesis protein CcdA